MTGINYSFEMPPDLLDLVSAVREYQEANRTYAKTALGLETASDAFFADALFHHDNSTQALRKAEIALKHAARVVRLP